MLSQVLDSRTSDCAAETSSGNKRRSGRARHTEAKRGDARIEPLSAPASADSRQTSFAAQDLSAEELAQLRRLLT